MFLTLILNSDLAWAKINVGPRELLWSTLIGIFSVAGVFFYVEDCDNVCHV